MKNILITDLSEKVLEEIYATGWTPKYKDRYRTEGVKPIVKYFDENGLLYYDEKALQRSAVLRRKSVACVCGANLSELLVREN